MPRKMLVIVTGGSSGIGFAVAKKFLLEGHTVIITGKNESKLSDAEKQLGDNCIALTYNMEDPSRATEFIRDIAERFGIIDVLVNNAGINQKKPLTEVSDEEYRKVVTVNQMSLFSITREVVRQMQRQESGGSIVNISSMAAHYGLPKVIAYTATKTAVEGMTRAMAVELASSGIRVNCVAPGFIRTAMTAKALNDDPDRMNRVMSRTPMNKMGVPEDVAEAVYFLSSDAASFITGETLKVDGGNSIGF